MLSGPTSVKAVRKMLMKLSPALIKAARKTLMKLTQVLTFVFRIASHLERTSIDFHGSISSTFYEKVFCTKVICEPFLKLRFGFVIFWRIDIGENEFESKCKFRKFFHIT